MLRGNLPQPNQKVRRTTQGTIRRLQVWIFGALTAMLLVSGSEAVSISPDPSHGMLGSLSFSAEALPSEQQQWYRRLLYATTSPIQYPNIVERASSGDLYQLGRFVNVHVSTLLAVFRATGDLRLLDEIDRSMQAARTSLRDTNNDGFLNWRWLHDPSNAQWYGDDWHVMDEAMTHGLVAAVAWVYANNRNLNSPSGIDYGERADFWRSYLINDFEAKWRQREGEAYGYDFIHDSLMHPYLQLTRFYHYMGKLTGDSEYTAQAERLAVGLRDDFAQIATESGVARVWGQAVRSPNQAAAVSYLQPTIYAGYSVLTLYELGLEGLTPFSEPGFLTEIANTITTFVIDNGSFDFAVDVGGNRARGGYDPAPNSSVDPSGFSRMSDEQFAIQSFGVLAQFDQSGQLLEVLREIYFRIEEPETPRRIYLPATIFLASRGATP